MISGGYVQFLALAYASPTLERLSKVPSCLLELTDVCVNGTQPRVRQTEVRIEFDGTLIERQSADFGTLGSLVLPKAERFQCVERSRRGLLDRNVELLNRAE